MKLREKKINAFGRSISAIAVVLMLLTTGIAGAAILNHYRIITSPVNVAQSVLVDGENYMEPNVLDTSNIVAGSTIVSAHTLYNQAEVPATVNLVTTVTNSSGQINPDGITTTYIVGLGVAGFGSGDDPFDDQYYRAIDYESSVNTLAYFSGVEYKFEITINTFDSTNIAPYVVIVGEGIGEYNVAVQTIPDGGTYETGTVYTKTIDETTLFHVPGSTVYTQSNPGTLAEIKGAYQEATLTKIRLAVGAWPGSGQAFNATMGISEINDAQPTMKSLKISPSETIVFSIANNFNVALVPDIYTITTTVATTAVQN